MIFIYIFHNNFNEIQADFTWKAKVRLAWMTRGLTAMHWKKMNINWNYETKLLIMLLLYVMDWSRHLLFSNFIRRDSQISDWQSYVYPIRCCRSGEILSISSHHLPSSMPESHRRCHNLDSGALQISPSSQPQRLCQHHRQFAGSNRAEQQIATESKLSQNKGNMWGRIHLSSCTVSCTVLLWQLHKAR